MSILQYRDDIGGTLTLWVSNSHKAEIQAHAAAKGESLNGGYVTKAVDERIERGRAVVGDADPQDEQSDK